MNGLQHTSAFVIQFRDDTDLAAGRFEGRVEHVISGRTACFHSSDELVKLLDRMVKNMRSARQREAEGLS